MVGILSIIRITECPLFSLRSRLIEVALVAVVILLIDNEGGYLFDLEAETDSERYHLDKADM